MEKEKQETALTVSERFTKKVLTQFAGNVGGMTQVTDYQKKLIQGYFVMIDRALKTAEEERVRKNAANKDHAYDNLIEVAWNNVNMIDLALDLVNYARLGLDMLQDNMLFPIPYKNNKTGKYDVQLMEGYNGIRYIAMHYAMDVPKDVTIEVVYKNDSFRPIKKGVNCNSDSYEFEIANPFDRGEIVGAFAYLSFDDARKNKLIIMSMKDIIKRKPRYASANFWGGKQTVWRDGKKTEEETEGWLDEMVRKTIIREAFSAKHLPRDPKKIDDVYQQLRIKELRYAEIETMNEIEENANATKLPATVEAALPPAQEQPKVSTAVPAEKATAPAVSDPDF